MGVTALVTGIVTAIFECFPSCDTIFAKTKMVNAVTACCHRCDGICSVISEL